GGRKSSQRKYFIPRKKRPAYKKCSANLELATIIKCVSVSCLDHNQVELLHSLSHDLYLPKTQ
ncbi:hypothetical protein EV368DRAFT_53557, partial [Lentinula lateritia]